MKIIFKNGHQELSRNKKYLIISLIISLYVFIPTYTILIRPKYILLMILSTVLLFLISKINKKIFLLVSLAILIINSILLHIILHWSRKEIDIYGRIDVAAISPILESIEYLMTHLNMFDVFIFIYFIIGLYLIYRLYIQLKHPYSIIKITAIILSILILVNIDHLTKIYPYNFINRYLNVPYADQIVKRQDYIHDFKNNTPTINKDLYYNKIIIILGESVNKNHMDIYGYNKKTTPFLAQLIKQEQSFKYNVIAPTNQTRFSVPIILTSATVKRYDDFYKSKSLVSTFREYGYKTYWLSNQAKGGTDGAVVSIAKEADYTKIKNLFWSQGTTDSILLKLLDKVYTETSNKEVYFFHLMGSHFRYKSRYDKNHTLFKKTNNIIEEYDNTIFFSDYILSQIYNKFKPNSKVLFIYISDHGELVTLDKCDHGLSPAYQDEYKIPFIIHSSVFNQRLAILKNLNKNRLINMESFNHVVRYLVGIDDNLTKISYNKNILVLSPENIFNYDDLIKLK